MIPHIGLSTGVTALKAVIVATTIAFSPAAVSPPPPLVIEPAIGPAMPQPTLNVTTDDALWRYLRAGLNYLEASGRDVPVDFVHPGGVAFGPLALTRIAVKDVILHEESFSPFTIDEVLSDALLYEEAARLYAHMLLSHYLKIRDEGLSREEVFVMLQKAWFLGPTIYRRGGTIPRSRARRALEYARGDA